MLFFIRNLFLNVELKLMQILFSLGFTQSIDRCHNPVGSKLKCHMCHQLQAETSVIFYSSDTSRKQISVKDISRKPSLKCRVCKQLMWVLYCPNTMDKTCCQLSFVLLKSFFSIKMYLKNKIKVCEIIHPALSPQFLTQIVFFSLYAIKTFILSQLKMLDKMKLPQW